MLDKESSGIFLAFALFPLTGVLGLHVLFLNNIGPKIFHFASRGVLIIIALLAFSPLLDCSGSCVVSLGALLIVPTFFCAIGLYIYTIIEAIFLFIKARSK